MRTHRLIVTSHGALRLYRDLSAKGVELSPGTPQRWAERESIPSEYWAALVDLGVATLDELVTSAPVRKRAAPKVGEASAA